MIGTLVEVVVDLVGVVDDDLCERIDVAVVAEMQRLEAIFSLFDDASELERWKRRELEHPGPELATALAEAFAWQARSAGAFNVAARPLQRLWREAAERGGRPADGEVDAVVASIATPPYRVQDDGRIAVVADLAGVDLNAFAKGWVVDRALAVGLGIVADAGLSPDAARLLVSAGGDLRHQGPSPDRIGIEHPLRPYDNEPPIATVSLWNGALATSGGARRGVRVGDVWHSHVVDPRTGRPADHLASISVIADDAATADVVATIAGLEPAGRALEAAESYGAAALVVTVEGEQLASAGWRSLSPD